MSKININIKQGTMELIQSGTILIYNNEESKISVGDRYTVTLKKSPNCVDAEAWYSLTRQNNKTEISIHRLVTGRVTKNPIFLTTEKDRAWFLTLWAEPIDDVTILYYGLLSASNRPQKEPVNEPKKDPVMAYKIYTDGACTGNPGPGGYCAIILCNGKEDIISGNHRNTTNNRMEIQAVIAALTTIKNPAKIELISDSQYVINALSKGWAKAWKKNGWMKSDGKRAQNTDLWETLLQLTQKHQMTYTWVKGHASNPYNNRCDAIAVEESHKATSGKIV